MSIDHSVAFVRYAAERRAVAGPRGAVVKLCRWHAPLAGRESSRLPPLRNRCDVRRWAGEGARAGDFVAAANRLWLEFCATLDEDEVKAARSLEDLDAPTRLHEHRRAVVMAWADAFADRVVTAAELREVWPVREAIGAATRPGLDPDEAVTAAIVSRFIREVAAAGLVCKGWRIAGAGREGHSKSARFRLSAG
jgi:hypothetical protein